MNRNGSSGEVMCTQIVSTVYSKVFEKKAQYKKNYIYERYE